MNVIVVKYGARVPWAPSWYGYCRACRKPGVRHRSQNDSDNFWREHSKAAEHRAAVRALRTPSDEERMIASIFGGRARSQHSRMVEERLVNKWYNRLKDSGHKTSAIADVGGWLCTCGESGQGKKSASLPHLRSVSESLGIRPLV